jgi:hypothetical protein
MTTTTGNPKITSISLQSTFHASGSYFCEIYHINTPNVKYRPERTIHEFINHIKSHQQVLGKWLTKTTTPKLTSGTSSRVVSSSRGGILRMNRQGGSATLQQGTAQWDNTDIVLTKKTGTLIQVFYHQSANYRSFNQINDAVLVLTIDVATMLSKIPAFNTSTHEPHGASARVISGDKGAGGVSNTHGTTYNSGNTANTYIDSSTIGSILELIVVPNP